MLTQHVRHASIDLPDLEQAVREHGVAALAEVDTAILEVDGTESTIPIAGSKITMPRPRSK